MALGDTLRSYGKRLLDSTTLDEKVKNILSQSRQGYGIAGRAIGNQAQKRIGEPARQWANNAYNTTQPRTNAQFAGAPLNYLTSQAKKATNIPTQQQGWLAPRVREAGNFSSNYTQTFGTGMQNMASMTDGANWRNALKTTKGVSQMVAPFLPVTGQYFVGANALSSADKPLDENDRIRRFSAGGLKGITQDQGVASNVEQRKTTFNIPIVGDIEFDPVMAAGEMLGYVKNPQNRILFNATNKIMPTQTFGGSIPSKVFYWLASTGIRGGIEDVLLNIGDMPENMSTPEKASWLMQTFGGGALSEIVGQGFFEGSGALTKSGIKVLAQVFDTFKGLNTSQGRKALQQATEQLKPIQKTELIEQPPTPDKPLGGMFAPARSRLIKPTEVQPRKANGQFDFKVELPKYVGDTIEKVKVKFRVDPKNPNRLIRLGENNQAMGLVAGIEPEFDEEGNFKGVKFNPTKAGLGIAAMGGIKAIKNGEIKPTKGVEPQDFTFNIGNNTKQTARVIDTPKGKRIKIIGNSSLGQGAKLTNEQLGAANITGKTFKVKPKEKPQPIKFQETEQEAAESIAKEYFDNPSRGRVGTVLHELKKIFTPLKNLPEETKRTVVDWNNSLIESKKIANEKFVDFSSSEPKLPGDNYEWLRAIENPKRQSNFTQEQNTYLKKVRAELDAARTRGLEAGIDIKYLDNYLNHVWKETTEEIEKIMAKGLGKRPSPTQVREIPDYETGIKKGLTPRFSSPSQLVAHYNYQINRAIANKKLVDQLLASKRLLPESAARKLGVYDWKAVNSPFFPKSQRVVGDGEILEENYVAPEDIHRVLSNIFEDKKGNFFLRGGAWVSKKMQDVTLSGGIPYTPANAFTFANMLKEFTAGRVVSPVHAFALSFNGKASSNYFKKNSDVISSMARDGINIRTNIDYDTVNKKIGQVFKESKLEGIDTVWNDAVTKPTFERFLPALQVNFYKDVLNKAQKSGLSGREAEKQAAEATKMFYGTIEEFARSKNTNDSMSALLFAPAWRESMINFWKNNLQSVNVLENRPGKKIPKLTIKNLKNPAFSANHKFLIGSMITIAAYDALNRKLNDGRSMFDNKEGKELYLEIPRKNGRSWYIPFQPSVSTVPRRAFEIAGNLMGGDVAGATARASTLFSQPINLAGQLATNQTFYGSPIYSEDDNAGQKLLSLAGYSGEQSAHPFIGEPLAVAQGRKTPTEAAMGALELPVYPSKSTTVSHLNAKQLEKYNEIAQTQGKEAADQYNQDQLLKQMGYDDYVLSDDAPTTKAERRNLTFKSAVANPIETIKLKSSGEPIRKLDTPAGGPLKFFDSATVSERMKNTSSLDSGDKSTQIDHVVPKWLGGRENKDNMQVLSVEDHAQKTKLDNSLREQYLAGDISKKEAKRQIAALNDNLSGTKISDEQWDNFTQTNEEEDASTPTSDLGNISELPSSEEELSKLYQKASTIVSGYEDKVIDLKYLDDRPGYDKPARLQELDQEKQIAENLIKNMEEKYPEKILDIQLEAYGSGDTDARAKWAGEKLTQARNKQEYNDLLDKMLKAKVISKTVAEKINDQFELNLTKYSYGDGVRSLSGKGKKPTAISVSTPKSRAITLSKIRKPQMQALKLSQAPSVSPPKITLPKIANNTYSNSGKRVNTTIIAPRQIDKSFANIRRM